MRDREIATKKHKSTKNLIKARWCETFVAKIVYRRSKRGTYLPDIAFLAPSDSNLFEQFSTNTLQNSYKSARTLTCLENECYLFHVLAMGQKLVAVVQSR